MRQGDIRYKKWYPGNEVRRAVQRSMPLGVGGVVEITALTGASAAEIKDAQLFFFPDWVDVRQGVSRLPETVREIEANVRTRIAAISEQPWSPEKKSKYTSIGNDMIRSCVEFRLSALEIIEQDDTIKQESDKKGHIAPHSAISELLLPQIEYKRKGELLAGNATETADLVREMRADRLASVSSKDKELDIERMKLENERLKLEIQLKGAEKSTNSTDTMSVEDSSAGSVVARPAETEGEGGETVVAELTSEPSFPFPTKKKDEKED